MKRRIRTAALAIATLAASALLLSGCVAFTIPPTASQSGPIGSVRISFTVCASGSTDCSYGNAGESAGSGPSQIFVGFRVPGGTVAPDSFSSSSTDPVGSGPQLVFTKNDGPIGTYASELQRLDPAPAGEEWVGYTSQVVNYETTSGDQTFSADVDFGLPAHADGSPFAGPFDYQVVVGARESGGLDDSEPVDCGSFLTDYWGGPGTSSEGNCVDDQATSDIDTDASIDTRDAGIVPGASTSVVAGGTATVPFTFAYAGKATGGAFSFQATSNVPGASATSSVATFAPGDNESKAVDVSVPVPADTAAGTYSVTLTAKLSDGESRTGTATLVVSAAPGPQATSPTVTVPVNGSRPLISGEPRQGSTLWVSKGIWSSGVVSYRYAWQRCKARSGDCKLIPQATGRSHKLTEADIGSEARALVIATSKAGSTQVASATVGPVKARASTVSVAIFRVRAPHGNAAKIAALLKHHGYMFSFRSPGPGRLAVTWYLRGDGVTQAAEQVVVARGGAYFSKMQEKRVEVALTERGRELLSKAGSLTICFRISFSQSGKKTFARTQSVTLES